MMPESPGGLWGPVPLLEIVDLVYESSVAGSPLRAFLVDLVVFECAEHDLEMEPWGTLLSRGGDFTLDLFTRYRDIVGDDAPCPHAVAVDYMVPLDSEPEAG